MTDEDEPTQVRQIRSALGLPGLIDVHTHFMSKSAARFACGSGPVPGDHTGPEPIRRLIRRYPRLRLIVAHLGMPEYYENAAALFGCELVVGQRSRSNSSASGGAA